MQSPVTAGWTSKTILTHGRKWQLEASILHYKNAKLLQDHTKLQNPNVSTSSHRLQLSILLILTPSSACGGPNYKACIILSIILLQDDFESVQSRKCSFYRHQTKGRNLKKGLTFSVKHYLKPPLSCCHYANITNVTFYRILLPWITIITLTSLRGLRCAAAKYLRLPEQKREQRNYFKSSQLRVHLFPRKPAFSSHALFISHFTLCNH